MFFITKKPRKNLAVSKKGINFAHFFASMKNTMKHIHHIFLTIVVLFVCVLSARGVDASYYSSLNGKKDSELRSALTVLLYSHHTLFDKYGESGTQNWDFPFDYDSNGYVWDIYTQNCNMPNTIGTGQSCCCDGLNREHLVCQSTFGGSSNKDKIPQYCDRHSLFLTDARTNQIRNDQAFGEVDKTSAKATNGDGSKCTNCTDHALGWKGPVKTYSDLYESTEMVYEPGDEYKGDIARAVLYMVVRYAEKQYCRLPDGAQYCAASGGGDVISDLTTANDHYVTTWKNKGNSTAETIGQLFSTDLATNYGLSAYGKAILLKWHRQDPVSQKEIDRNAGVEAVQGNRNPFIDYPCLVEYIWGNKAGSTFNTNTVAGSFQDGLFSVGASDGCSCSNDPMISVPSGTVDLGVTNTVLSTSLEVPVRGLFLLDGTLSLSINGGDTAYFTLSGSFISSSDALSGTKITITYAPKAVGNHSTTLRITGCGVESHEVTLTGICEARPTVTWIVDGASYHANAVVSGARPTVPAAPSDCSGDANRVFVGWTSENNYNDATNEPADLFTKKAPTVNSDIAFYAVYANTTISGGLSDYALYTGDITEGNYIIYNGGRAMKASVTSNRFDYTAVTPTNNIISDPDASLIWHFEKSDNDWLIFNASVSKYAAGNGTNNQGKLVEDEEESALWSVEGNSTYTIVNNYNLGKSKNANLRNNGDYGFACYSSTYGQAPVLYKSTLSVEYSDYSTHCSTDNYVTVTFYKNDGSDATTTQSIQKNTTTALKSNTWTREHYTFQGWATSADGTKTYDDGANINTDANMSLYAVWKENDKCTVTWYVAGEPTSIPYYIGADLALPALTPSCGDEDRVFVGWSAQSSYNHDSAAPEDLFTVASGTVSANAQYYAVFADKSSIGGTTTESVTFSNRYSEDTSIEATAVSIGDNTSVTFTKGSSASKYYATGSAVRWYGGGTCVITSSAANIVQIVITFAATDDGGNEITADAGTYENGTWTGDAQTVTFTQGGTKGQRRIAGIAVTFGTTPVTTYSKYNTLCAACVSASTPSPLFVNAVVELMTPAEVVTNALNKDGSDGQVAYSSSAESVATVNATTGEVTVVGAGTTTITADLAATSCYNAASASYTLTVHDFQATAATNVSSNSFTANWTTAGVSTYSLDVTADAETVESQPTTFIYKNFLENLDGWTINNVSGYENVWTHSAKYGAYGNTYVKVNDEYVRYAAESWLLSPSIDLTNATAATLTMNNFFRFASTVYLMISDDGGNTWTALSPSNWTMASSYTYVDSEVDLGAYVGKTIQMGFKYVGTTTASPAWEIKTFTISGTANVQVVSHESLAGYPKNITGTSAAVTGLTEATTYHYTVTPQGGTTSNEIDVTTSEASACTATITVQSLDDTKGTAGF